MMIELSILQQQQQQLLLLLLIEVLSSSAQWSLFVVVIAVVTVGLVVVVSWILRDCRERTTTTTTKQQQLLQQLLQSTPPPPQQRTRRRIGTIRLQERIRTWIPRPLLLLLLPLVMIQVVILPFRNRQQQQQQQQQQHDYGLSTTDNNDAVTTRITTTTTNVVVVVAYPIVATAVHNTAELFYSNMKCQKTMQCTTTTCCTSSVLSSSLSFAGMRHGVRQQQQHRQSWWWRRRLFLNSRHAEQQFEGGGETSTPTSMVLNSSSGGSNGILLRHTNCSITDSDNEHSNNNNNNGDDDDDDDSYRTTTPHHIQNDKSTTPTAATGSSSSSSSSSSSTEGLSKFHHSILRHCGTRRQRFVTGRYPIVLTFRNNPTRKWLNNKSVQRQRSANGSGSSSNQNSNNKHILAETEIFVNGTLASQSVASLDRFYWYDDHERQIQQEQYGMISMELLAEIHVDRPGYVTILSSQTAGRRAATTHQIQHQLRQRGNRWTVQAMNVLKLYNDAVTDHQRHSASRHSSSSVSHQHYSHESSIVSPPTARNEHHRRLIEIADDITRTNGDRLWVTGFGLTGRQGSITAIDCEQCHIQPLNDRSKNTMQWPNEVQMVPINLLNQQHHHHLQSQPSPPKTTMNPINQYQDAILVCDGFLVPTKDRGGIYIVKHPGHDTEWTISLTTPGDRWFYHRAVWMDLTNDGRQSILTARCQLSTVLDTATTTTTRTNGVGVVTSGVTKSGQLVWLECPQPSMIDPITGTPLEKDGTMFDPFNTRHLPWKEHVLATGPDVMFAVADLDTSDGTIEVLASEFFNKQVTLTSIQCGIVPTVQFKRVIDDQSGQAFGCILANLDTNNVNIATLENRCVVDTGSTVNCLNSGQYFSHLLVTSHECKYVENEELIEEGILEVAPAVNGRTKSSSTVSSTQNLEGGSLFAYCVPKGKDAWRTAQWERSIVASGFNVRGKLNNMINPGAPGFVYTFYANLKDAREKVIRPLIAVAGDCAESAYIFRPDLGSSRGDQIAAATTTGNDVSTNYKLMAEIQCEATVGSIGIGYNDFSNVEQESEYAKLYIPCFEADKIMVFGLGSGEDDNVNNNW